MRHKAWVLGLIGAALVAASCEDITTRQGSGTFATQVALTGSSFVANGDTLAGDTVQFVGTVSSEGGQIPSAGQRFTSDNPAVVEILNDSTGTAVFKSVGTARVTVTFEEPAVAGSEKLFAYMDVHVSMYQVELGLVSTITGNPVDTANALVTDTVQVVPNVTLNGQPVTGGGLRIVASTDSTVADPNTPSAPDLVALADTGGARLTVTLDEPPIPDGLLSSSIGIDVKSLIVELKVESLVPGSTQLAAGDTLVTDSVQFSGIAITAVTDTTPITGATWTSSDSTVVRVTDGAAGIAVFEGVGTAVVRVDIQVPAIPIKIDSMIVPVTTYVTTMDLSSNYSGGATDTLVTDSVTVSPIVKKNGVDTTGVVLQTVQSTDSSIIAVRDGAAGIVVFADTGTADLIMLLDQPRLPRAMLGDTLPLRVTTYLASISGPTAPLMGDTLQYVATVTDTRGDTALTAPQVTFTSTDTTVIRYFDAATGLALARDTGTAVVGVTLDSPALPGGAAVADSLAPIQMTKEYFYGAFSTTTGDFGDTVVVYADEVHTFTDSTRISFPNGTVLFVDTNWTDSVLTRVGAGSQQDTLTLNGLLDGGGQARDGVATRFAFAGLGGATDPYEPNDTFPLTAADSVGLDFEAFLSLDPTKTGPADNDFFWFRLSGGATTQTVVAEWQQVANLDFYVCASTGGPLPTGIDPLGCVIVGNDTSTTGPEIGSAVFGPSVPWVLRVWCQDTCGTEPITYKLTVTKQ